MKNRLIYIFCFWFTLASQAQVIKFQSVGGVGAVTSTGTGINHVGIVGNLVSQGSGQANQVGFLFGSLDYRPESQTTGIQFSELDPNQLTLTWTNGNGARRVVIGRASGDVTSSVTSATYYPANTVFGSGTEVGTDNFVVSDGTDNQVTVTGLLPSTVYHFKAFEYNGKYDANNVNIEYQTDNVTGNPASRTTLASPPSVHASGLSLQSVTKNSMTLSWINGDGGNRLAIVREANPVSSLPVDGDTYSANSQFGLGAYLGTDNYVVLNSNANSVPVTDLLPNTTYHFEVVEYTGSGADNNYYTEAPPSISQITKTTEPVAIAVSTIDQTFFTANWQAVPGGVNYYLDVSDNSAFTSFVPGFENKQLPGETLTASVTDLLPGTTYYYQVRAENAAGQSENSNFESVLTLPDTPVLTLSSAIDSTSFTANWSALQSAISYTVDVADNSGFTTSLPDFPKVVTSNSVSVSSLTPGTPYFVRVKAGNTSGLTPYSTVYNQYTICVAPIANEPTQIQDTNFKANWHSVSGATAYEITVSESSIFTSTVSVIDDLTETEEIVTGLTKATKYYYKVRAKNPGGYSAYSNTKQLITSGEGSFTEPKVNIGQLSIANLTSTHEGGEGQVFVTLYHRPISGSDYVAEDPQLVAGSSTTFTVNSSWLDELGMELYFKVKDEFNQEGESTKGYIYQQVPPNTSILNTSSGGKLENYRIVSVPYILEDNLVQSIFGALGEYDKELWRLIQYDPLTKKNVDYPAFNRFGSGEGYWFNSVEKVDLRIGSGTVPQFNQATPFTMRLEQGWNQIGAPYPFDVKWSAVQTANTGKPVGKLFVFNPTTQTMVESDDLKVWSGGFVHADNAIPDFTYPVTLKNPSGGRRKSEDLITNTRLDEPAWFIPITLRQGLAESRMAVGMHPEASAGKDRFDQIAIPRFFSYLEMTTTHPEFFSPAFAYDVVPTEDQKTWDFIINSSFSDAASLEWDPSTFGNNPATLILFDEHRKTFADMRSTNHYALPANKDYPLKVIYSNNQEWNPGVSMLGYPFPNPAIGPVTIPVALHEPASVQISVYDLTGKKVKTLASGYWEAGMHSVTWTGEDEQPVTVPPAMYVVQMTLGTSFFTQKIIIR
jgi:hypothetical protein